MTPTDMHRMATKLDEIQGTVALAYDTVLREAGTNQELTHAWCSLGLAKEALGALRKDLDAPMEGV